MVHWADRIVLHCREKEVREMGVHDGHRQRLRERFLAHGLDSFQEHEVLELLLTYAIPRKDVNPIAHDLMDHFGSLESVLSATTEELCRVNGIGESAAALLRLIFPAYNYARSAAAGKEKVLNSPEKVGSFLLAKFAGVGEERMYELCLDMKGKLLACHLVGAGTVDAVSFSARQIAVNALQSQASVVILAHNHPSGVALPSQEDIVATRMAAEALRALNIELADHIVVADNDYVSMAANGTAW